MRNRKELEALNQRLGEQIEKLRHYVMTSHAGDHRIQGYEPVEAAIRLLQGEGERRRVMSASNADLMQQRSELQSELLKAQRELDRLRRITEIIKLLVRPDLLEFNMEVRVTAPPANEVARTVGIGSAMKDRL